MNVSRTEKYLVVGTTVVVVLCLGALYLNHYLVERTYENCRFYAKGIMDTAHILMEKGQLEDKDLKVIAPHIDIVRLASDEPEKPLEIHEIDGELSGNSAPAEAHDLHEDYLISRSFEEKYLLGFPNKREQLFFYSAYLSCMQQQ